MRLQELMTKSTGYFLILTAFICSCKKDSLSSKVELDPFTGFEYTYSILPNDTINHGPYFKKDSMGILLEKGNYENGELHGVREIYFPDGKVKVRERYNNGTITDLYEYFFPNGKHELKGYYVDGAMYGPWKKYDDQGNLIEVVTMIDNEEMGPFSEYYANGKIQAEGAYIHGPNEDGLLNLFNESGELYKKMLCDSGICVTIWSKE